MSCDPGLAYVDPCRLDDKGSIVTPTMTPRTKKKKKKKGYSLLGAISPKSFVVRLINKSIAHLFGPGLFRIQAPIKKKKNLESLSSNILLIEKKFSKSYPYINKY